MGAVFFLSGGAPEFYPVHLRTNERNKKAHSRAPEGIRIFVHATGRVIAAAFGRGRKVRATQSSLLPNGKVFGLQKPGNRKCHRKDTALLSGGVRVKS